MKLKDLLSEMSMPATASPDQAVRAITAAYNSAVIKKQPNGDLYGPLVAGLKYLQNSTSPEKYARQIKMGIAAKKTMDQMRKGLSSNQSQFTTVK